ncbi:MAG: carboxypeptidase-like regulatory domain-containing protein [Fusobacteriaceae bacterium]
MIKIGVRGLIIFVFFILSNLVFSFEEAYVEIKAKNLKNSFFMIQYDYEQDIPYVGVEALKDFLEIKTLEWDKKNRVLSGKFSEEDSNVQITVPKPSEGLPEDDVYLTLEELSEIFKLKEHRWESSSLKIEIVPDYKLTYELVREAEQRIKKLENKKNNDEKYVDVYGEKRLLAPGILKLDYNNYNMRESVNYLKAEYGTQLFYGDFYLNQKIVPELKLETITLEYREFLGNKGTLSLGDTYIQRADYYDVEKNIRGISYSKDDIYGFTKNNEIVISGKVTGARLVELLQNNSLLDYVRLSGEENYSFNVSSSSVFAKYSVKIYYEDGRIETKDVNILSSSLILPKGESDYSFQLGEGEDNKRFQQQYNYRYGLYRDMSVGIGWINGSGDDGSINAWDGEVIWRIPWSILPTVLELNVLNEKQDKRPNYIAKINQKFKEIGIYGEYHDFSNNLAEQERYEKYYNLQLSRGFGNFDFSIGGERELYNSLYSDIYSFNIGYSGFKDLSLGIYNEYENIKGFDGFYSLELRGVYSGLSYVSIISEAKYNFSSEKDTVSEYGVKVNRKISRESSFRDLDLSVELNHKSEIGTTFGVSFTWYFDKDSIYLETPINHIDGELEVGLRVQKSFILEEPLAKVNPKNVNDSWIEGVVFLDINGNGLLDSDEELLEDIEVSPGIETDSEGRYKITNLSGKSLHKVQLVGSSLDAMLEPKYEFRVVKPVPSTGVTVDIPVSPVSLVSGEIKIIGVDEKEMFKILSKSTVLLKKDDEVMMKTTSEFDGYYYIEGVLPGKYQLEIQYSGDIDLEIEKSSYSLDIKPGKEGEYYEENDFVLNKITEEVLEEEIMTN